MILAACLKFSCLRRRTDIRRKVKEPNSLYYCSAGRAGVRVILKYLNIVNYTCLVPTFLVACIEFRRIYIADVAVGY
jgi:hypothetical protein